MRPARIILIAVALIAGGLAAYLILGMTRTPANTVVTEVVRQEAKTQILVAKNVIGVGERLTADIVEWQDWPEGALRSEYVTVSATPDAPADLTGAVARFEFFPGEPIREAKLVRADQGYLSAVLSKGMRGVSVPVSAESSAGGFVVPNDHVDVVLTQQDDTGNDISRVVLANVRVLAIGKRLGEVGASGGQESGEGNANPQAKVFDDRTIATLELDPPRAETLINAASMGSLSLVLRSIADFNDNTVTRSNASNRPVRLIRFGQERNVMAEAGEGSMQMSGDALVEALTNPAMEGSPMAPPVPEAVMPQIVPQ